MGLSFGDRRWHDEVTGTVIFPGFAGKIRISCSITDEALKAVFGAGAKDGDLVDCFDRCRASIETAALRKFDTTGEPRKLVLVTNDFETRAPAKEPPKPPSGNETAARMRRYRASGVTRQPSLIHEPDSATVAVGQAEPAD